MTNATHTPGPWSVSNNGDSVLAATNTIVIAKCKAGPVRFLPGSQSEILANTRLCAAAPDLYTVAILQNALDVMDWDYDEGLKCLCNHGYDPEGIFTAVEFVHRARNAAITKAMGA